MFEALVRDNAQALHIFLRALIPDPGRADDLFQETLIAAWNGIDSFDSTRPFGRWLRGIARNLVRSQHRRSVNEQVLADEGWVHVLERHCEAAQRLRNDVLDERLSRLRECVDRLPEHYRETLDGHYRSGLRGEALAARIGATIDAAMKRLQRARRLVSECMQRTLAGAEVRT